MWSRHAYGNTGRKTPNNNHYSVSRVVRFQRHDGTIRAALTLARTDIEIRREERCNKEAEAAGVWQLPKSFARAYVE